MTAFRATYRLQLGPGLDFAAVRALVPYLRDLGVSHLYLSPVFAAREGSTHGYDVVDPRRINDDLGGEDGLRALAEAGLGVILDIVPNHMATDEANPFWADEGLRARFFDIDPATGKHRRFFDIDHLAGVRQEDEEVFATTHELVLRLLAEGAVDGVRVDHPDGLADPSGYLTRLAEGGAQHVWVEKILHPGEPLRDWPVEGTTGYEFANDVQGLFVDPTGEAPLSAFHRELTGERRTFAEVAFEAKLEQACGTFSPEVERLRREGDVPEEVDLPRALASLDVYRTYVWPPRHETTEADREVLTGLDVSLLTRERFITRFQQTTPPVMAKGVEDTAFYRYTRLLALNEVGGDPGRFGISVATFHAANAERAQRFPRTLLVTQTHDTKRSGDTRARIGALSAMADDWRRAVQRWQEINAPLRTSATAPTPDEEYLLYQTLVGTWPITADRLAGYLEKAMREAKVDSNWLEPNVEHEAAVQAFAAEVIEHGPFLFEFEGFAARVAEAGERSALGQLLLKLTVPGVPDVYQGDELWALALVDPDNRREVEWERRRELLDELRAGAAPTRETRKLWTIWRALDLRARRSECFEAGAYEPVAAGEEVCAFRRGEDVLVAVAVRDHPVVDAWDLPAGAAGRWRDVLTGAEHELPDRATLAGILGPDGMALLERVG
ncbi:MAG TPA: malto-oligosyltrehalose synthase [Solirubrobacteraceae bacterium]|nr:malto-oligosyltrehalose synthase [Solirubrobacteraceae bacterium]